MSPLGLLNFLVLQWFGVRLARSLPGPMPYGLMPGDGPIRIACTGSLPAGLRSDVDYYVARGGRWTVLRWIWPLTGWWSSYRWIARHR